mmetsp:Transcript_42150/g.132079  ORF Transcript_42150/g.132079 Transcript_42150/m.132079 type:complete len:273 (-) Transcript_42150:246-1064(-)
MSGYPADMSRYPANDTARRLVTVSHQCNPTGVACDLCARKWLFVIATGRSGSTTVEQMLNALPQVQITGEHAGAFKYWRKLWEGMEITNSRKTMPFLHEHVSQNMFYCHIQDWYWKHSDGTCKNGEATVHGFKEVRYNDRANIDWLKEVFPCAKFIFSYREDVSHYSSFKEKLSKEYLEEERDLLKWYTSDENPWNSQTFAMPLEALGSTQRWDNLLEWIEHPECKHQFTLHANHVVTMGDGSVAAGFNSDDRGGVYLCNGEPVPPLERGSP